MRRAPCRAAASRERHPVPTGGHLPVEQPPAGVHHRLPREDRVLAPRPLRRAPSDRARSREAANARPPLRQVAEPRRSVLCLGAAVVDPRRRGDRCRLRRPRPLPSARVPAHGKAREPRQVEAAGAKGASDLPVPPISRCAGCPSSRHTAIQDRARACVAPRRRRLESTDPIPVPDVRLPIPGVRRARPGPLPLRPPHRLHPHGARLNPDLPHPRARDRQRGRRRGHAAASSRAEQPDGGAGGTELPVASSRLAVFSVRSEAVK